MNVGLPFLDGLRNDDGLAPLGRDQASTGTTTATITHTAAAAAAAAATAAATIVLESSAVDEGSSVFIILVASLVEDEILIPVLTEHLHRERMCVRVCAYGAVGFFSGQEWCARGAGELPKSTRPACVNGGKCVYVRMRYRPAAAYGVADGWWPVGDCRCAPEGREW